jgi:hypothetical protein
MWIRDPPIPIKFRFSGYFGSPFHISRMYLHQATAIVKESKYFRKQAEKAERMAQAISDAEISQSFMNMAKAYHSHADMLRPRSRWLRKSPAKSGAKFSGIAFGHRVSNPTLNAPLFERILAVVFGPNCLRTVNSI